MARIRSITPSNQRLSVHPTEVDCEYVVVDTGTERLLHLNTFGSDNRVCARKSSQSLQLDEDQARRLIEVIKKTFPTLGGA